jgi:hypothetical protein
MPVVKYPYYDKHLFSFFEGLIPEGWLLDIAKRHYKINPNDRPSAGALLNNPIVQDHYGDRPLNNVSWENDELLRTIKLNSRNYK